MPPNWQTDMLQQQQQQQTVATTGSGPKTSRNKEHLSAKSGAEAFLFCILYIFSSPENVSSAHWLESPGGLKGPGHQLEARVGQDEAESGILQMTVASGLYRKGVERSVAAACGFDSASRLPFWPTKFASISCQGRRTSTLRRGLALRAPREEYLSNANYRFTIEIILRFMNNIQIQMRSQRPSLNDVATKKQIKRKENIWKVLT